MTRIIRAAGGTFSGSHVDLTNVTANQHHAQLHAVEHQTGSDKVATGVPDGTKFLRDDFSWQAASGSAGPTGATGPIGLTGDDGEDGQHGPPGATGATGIQGAPGASGAAGPAVFLVGEDGDEGPIGPPGVTGPQGATGTTGNTGAAGPTGPAVFLVGEDGEEGAAGPPGATGPQGATGSAGATGAQGLAIFLVGDDGEEGAAGPPGATGPQGPQGASGTGGSGTTVFLLEDADIGDVGILQTFPTFPVPPNAVGTDVPVTYDDEGTFTLNTTGRLTQPNRLTISGVEHVVGAGTASMDLVDTTAVTSTYSPASFTVLPDRFMYQYNRLSLRSEQRATLIGNGEILLSSIYPVSRLVLTGVGAGT